MDEAFFAQMASDTLQANAAARSRAERVASELMGHCRIDQGSGLGEPLLRHAWRHPSVDAFFLAMRLGVSARDCLASTANRWGMETTPVPGSGQEESLRSLVAEAGSQAIIERPLLSINLHTMLDTLAMFGDPGALGLALEVGGPKALAMALDPKTKEGRAPLSWAAESRSAGARACCELLLERGSDPNRGLRSAPSWGALRFAARAGNADICLLLARAGAYPGDPGDPASAWAAGDEPCRAAMLAGAEGRELDGESKNPGGQGKRRGGAL